MRQHYIVSGILLILPIIDIAVTVPALVKEKPQAGINVMNIPKDPITVLRKRNDELNELWLEFFGHPESHFLENLEESSAAHPSLSSLPSGPTDGSMDVEQPSIPKEPSPVTNPDHAPPIPGNEMNELWLKLFGHPESYFFGKPEESSAAHLSSSSLPSGPADGSMDVEQPSIPKEPSPVTNPDHAPPIPSDETNELWLKLFGHPESHFPPNPEELSAGPTNGWTDLTQPLSPIPEEPSPVSSPDHAPPSPGSLTGYELMKGDVPPGPSGPASTMSSADHELMGAHVLPNSGPSTDSDHEIVDVPPSSPVSSANPDPQWMSSDSASGKRKRPWLLML
ncbi:hypothetical protein F5888DRAFT_1667911, partial [Russula emetica]